MKALEIPKDSVKRLFLYYRTLLESRASEVISSEELSRLTGCSAAQIRKDLTYFGQFGTPGKGYQVAELSHRIKSILGIDRDWDVALIGVGNLGKALLAYPGLKAQGFNIVHLFDASSDKIGKNMVGLKIKNIRNIQQELKDNPVKIAILAVPAVAAQEAANLLAEVGIKGILNFAPTRIQVPPPVRIINMDITHKLALLSYYASADNNPEANGFGLSLEEK